MESLGRELVDVRHYPEQAIDGIELVVHGLNGDISIVRIAEEAVRDEQELAVRREIESRSISAAAVVVIDERFHTVLGPRRGIHALPGWVDEPYVDGGWEDGVAGEVKIAGLLENNDEVAGGMEEKLGQLGVGRCPEDAAALEKVKGADGLQRRPVPLNGNLPGAVVVNFDGQGDGAVGTDGDARVA